MKYAGCKLGKLLHDRKWIIRPWAFVFCSFGSHCLEHFNAEQRFSVSGALMDRATPISTPTGPSTSSTFSSSWLSGG